MRSDGVISTRGLKADAEKFGELIFDVNSAYFFNHGGYEFAVGVREGFNVVDRFVVFHRKTSSLYFFTESPGDFGRFR